MHGAASLNVRVLRIAAAAAVETCEGQRAVEMLVGASYDESRTTYGSPRVHEDLLEAGDRIGRNRVTRLMKAGGLVARVRKLPVDDDKRTRPNLLNREFEATARNQRWVGDTTELLTSSGKFFLAAIIDLYARLVVGWAVSAVNDRRPSATADPTVDDP